MKTKGQMVQEIFSVSELGILEDLLKNKITELSNKRAQAKKSHGGDFQVSSLEKMIEQHETLLNLFL